MGDASITAIIVSYNSAHVLPACFAALRKQGVGTIIVVDNASSDASAEVALAAGAEVIQNSENKGFGVAMNQGVRAAVVSDYCLLLNPDAILGEGAFQVLQVAIAAYPDAAILAPAIVEPDGRVFIPNRPLLAKKFTTRKTGALLPDGDCCLEAVSGAAMLVHREKFQALGGFDEQIFLFYEDDDLCRRVVDAGHSIVYVHQARLQHARGTSVAGSAAHVAFIRYHLAFARSYICRKYGLPPQKLRQVFLLSAKYLWACISGNAGKRARYLGSLLGTLKG